MEVTVVLDLSSGAPPYEQVRSQLEAAITHGTLAPGTRLPTVRRMADDLGLAVNTVARAYKELEQGGFVVTRRRLGTFVAVREAAAHERAVRAARDFAAEIRATGTDPSEALRLAREALADADEGALRGLRQRTARATPRPAS
jgi:DNA-binding transcriptional regulator YhcF (GntR family)